MYLTYIFSDFLSSALPPVIWLNHPAASTRPVVRRLLPVYRPGSWFVSRPCNIVCFCTIHVLYAHRAMFPVQRKVNTRQQFTNIRKGFEQWASFWTGREQAEDTRYVMNKNQANVCYTADPSKRIPGSTRTANGRVCIISTICNNTAALNSHIRHMWFTTLQQRSCSKSVLYSKTVQQLTAFLSVFIIFCVLKFYWL